MGVMEMGLVNLGIRSVIPQFERALEEAGIQINGSNPWDLQIDNKDKALPLILQKGTLSAGETLGSLWYCDDLAELVSRVVCMPILRKMSRRSRLLQPLQQIFADAHNTVREDAAIEHHYDYELEWYKSFLDAETMKYTCAYWKELDWKNPNNLAEAQKLALHRLCRMLKLEPGMRVLDIGCGFGSFAKFAAIHYGVSVVGITISDLQLQFARESCFPLPVEIYRVNYQDLLGVFPPGHFDRIVSVGMFEHVGPANYRRYFTIARRLLKEDGFFLCHTITSPWGGTDAFLETHIFPDAYIPAHHQIFSALNGLFVVEANPNIGAHYDPTLCAWDANAKKSRQRLKALNSKQFTDKFFFEQEFYFLSCAGSFRARNLHVMQFVLSPNGIRGGYEYSD